METLDWSIPGGQMPVRQPCPECGQGEYGWTASLWTHLFRKHDDLSRRQISLLIDEAVRRSRQEALKNNGGR